MFLITNCQIFGCPNRMLWLIPLKKSDISFRPFSKSSVRFLRRFCNSSYVRNFLFGAWIPRASWKILMWTSDSSFWSDYISFHIVGWSCPTSRANELFQPSHTLLVRASLFSVESWQFQDSGGKIGFSRLKRTPRRFPPIWQRRNCPDTYVLSKYSTRSYAPGGQFFLRYSMPSLTLSIGRKANASSWPQKSWMLSLFL